MATVARLADEWLPKPKILHPWPHQRFAVKYPDAPLPAEFKPSAPLKSAIRLVSPREHPDFGWAWITHFLINLGNATAADIETLGETVRQRVKESSGVELEWEIKRIGVA